MFVVSADEDDCIISVHLSPAPFRERIVRSLRYLFGRQSKWGDFAEVLITPEMALDLGDKLIEWAQGEGTAFKTSDVY